MKVKTSELSGAALDWAVAKAEGEEVLMLPSGLETLWTEDGWKPSKDWAQGGPIIEREKISVLEAGKFWGARPLQDGVSSTKDSFGNTPLVAAMRCYVLAKLGEEVEIPEDLQ